MGCWSDFGGLAGQLNHLSIVLHLAITENVTLALIYDQELKQHAQRLARRRDEQVDFYQLFSQENDEIKRNIKTEWEKTKSKKALLAEKASKGLNKKGGKGDKGKGWQPQQLPYQAPQTQFTPFQTGQRQVKGGQGRGKGKR